MPAEELQISGLNPISALTTGCQIGTDDASNVTYKFTLTQLNTFLENYFLLQANNLDDLPSISTAVTNLGLTIGTNTQAYSSVLTSIAGASIVDSAVLVTSAGGSPMFSTTLPAGTGLPGYLPLTGGTMTGSLNLGSQTLTGLTAPVNASDAATKAYADNIAAGFNPIQSVYSASTANLTGYTYNNGTAGVGATLTAPSNGVFTGDGLTPPVGSRYLYKNDTTGAGVYNGIYTLTTSTSGSPAVLTRATDYNTANDIQPGDLISVEAGTVNIGSSWYQTATIVAVGTTAVAFSQFFSPASYVSSMLSSGTIYIGNDSNVATQSNSTWPASTTINQILYSSASNTVSGIAAANNGVLVTSAAGVPSVSTTLPSDLTIPDLKTNGIFDSTYGLSVFNITSVANSVNFLNIIPSTAGNPIQISPAGTDTNITLELLGKGTGGAAIEGTTAAGNAPAGFVGEVISSVVSSGSAVSFTSNVTKDLTSISLTAGDWDVYGNIQFTATAAIESANVWCSLISATEPDVSLISTFSGSGNINISLPAPFFRVNVASTTNVFLSGRSVISTGTMTACGQIYARRVR